jgi:hypothetical protein
MDQNNLRTFCGDYADYSPQIVRRIGCLIAANGGVLGFYDTALSALSQIFVLPVFGHTFIFSAHQQQVYHNNGGRCVGVF